MWPRKQGNGEVWHREVETQERPEGQPSCTHWSGLIQNETPSKELETRTIPGEKTGDQTCRTGGLSWIDESWMQQRKGEATGCPRLRTGSPYRKKKIKEKEDAPKRQKSRRCRDPKGRRCVLMGPLKSCRRQDKRDRQSLHLVTRSGWRGGAEARLPVWKPWKHECGGPWAEPGRYLTIFPISVPAFLQLWGCVASLVDWFLAACLFIPYLPPGLRSTKMPRASHSRKNPAHPWPWGGGR